MSDFVPNSKVCAGTVLSQDNFNQLFMEDNTSLLDPNSQLVTQKNDDFLTAEGIVNTEGYDQDRKTAWEAMEGEAYALEACAIEWDYYGYRESLTLANYCCWYMTTQSGGFLGSLIFRSETVEDETEVIQLAVSQAGPEDVSYGATLVVGEPFPETEEPETEESEDEVESATAFGSVSMAAIAASLIILNQ